MSEGRGNGEVVGAARTAPEPKPNVLFLITDDQRHDQLGSLNPVIQTPEMDRLVAEGTRYEHAFVTSPICAASRASILSGTVERTHKYNFDTGPLSEQSSGLSFPAVLRDRGYRTGYVGKLGVELTPEVRDRSFDVLEELDLPYWHRVGGHAVHLTRLEADRAEAFLEDHQSRHSDQPFMLTVGFNAPHAQDEAPEQYFWLPEVDSLYRDVAVAAPALADPTYHAHMPEYLRFETESRIRWHWRFDFESKRVRMTRGYWRMLSGVDLMIGRLRRTLERLEVADRTVIVLFGDNGMFLGDRGFADKWLPFDESIRVPLLVMDPRGVWSSPGDVATDFVLNIDLAPTFAAMSGGQPLPGWQGRALARRGEGQVVAQRDDIWIEHLYDHPRIRRWEGIRSRRYKYARFLDASPPLELLFDLDADPLETTNLVPDPRSFDDLERCRARTAELRESFAREQPARNESAHRRSTMP